MDPVKHAALIWYRAENPEPRPHRMTLGDIFAVAIPRVMAVLGGEVRWSEASPGDKAIWVGRPRNIALFHERADWTNFWDTICIGPGEMGLAPWRLSDPLGRTASGWVRMFGTASGWVRMFGNYNVGNWWLCNMQVAGQLPCDQFFHVEQMYAHTDRLPDTTEAITLSLVVRNKQVAASHIQDAIAGHPCGLVIAPRDDFGVRVDWTRVVRPITIRVHLEGVTSRT